MINMLEIIVAACGGAVVGGLFSLITWGLNRRAAKKDRWADRHSGLEMGVQVLLYDRIKYLCKCYMSAGHITSSDLEDLTRMHTIYHNDLGGNGFLDDLMRAIHRLPIK